MVNAQGLVKYRFCSVNSLNWRTVCSVVYVWKEEFNSELSSSFKYNFRTFPGFSSRLHVHFKALLIYLFDELSPSKNRFDHTSYHYLSDKACHHDMSSNKQMFFMSEVKLDLATEICLTAGEFSRLLS